MRVLVVEDDPRLGQNLVRGLRETGFAPDLVGDGESAVAAALANPYDVVVLDLMIPGLDGFEVCRQLRARRLGTPILMLTARGGVEDRVRGLDSGADDYLVKPFYISEVAARIRALSRRHLPDRTAVLSAGPLSLDTAARRLEVSGEPVPLTAKEFEVLECLLRNRGQVLSQEQIIQSAWDREFEGGYNLVEVYVGRLRRKLGEHGVGGAIQTVRGAGYRLAVEQ